MNILYIDGVGPFGGASRSLYETVRCMYGSEFEAYFWVVKGTASGFYEKTAKDMIRSRGMTRFDNTAYSHYRGVRWLVLFRELLYFPFMILGLVNVYLKWKKSINLIHVNEITEIIPGVLAKLLLNVPLIVHVRSVQCSAPTLRTKLLYFLLQRYVNKIVAIDKTVKGSLPKCLDVEVVHNSFAIDKNDSSDSLIIEFIKNLPKDNLKVGFVGNLQISKGLFDLLESANLLKKNGICVEFIIVGGHTREAKGLKGWLLRKAGLNHNVHDQLLSLIEAYGLRDNFHLLGATPDIRQVYELIDVVAFPSHYDAPGRPIFEAAFSGVPCVTCISTPTDDTFIQGETGLSVPQENPVALAEAISFLNFNRNEVKRMGGNACALAVSNFDVAHNTEKLKGIYAEYVV